MRIYQGLLAGALLGLLEATTFIIERPVKDRGDRFLVAGCLLLMIPFFVALLSVISSSLIGWAETLGSRRLGGGSRGIGVLAGVLIFPFAQALTSGEAISAIFIAPLLPYLMGILIAGSVAGIAKGIQKNTPSKRIGMSLLAVSAVFIYLDRQSLVGLYPAWHHLLALCAALTVLGGVSQFSRSEVIPKRRAAVLALCSVIGLGLFTTRVWPRPLLIQAVAEHTSIGGNIVEGIASLGLRPGRRRELDNETFARLAAVHSLGRGFELKVAHQPLKAVVLITLEATRLDHMGYAGYERPVSPNIDTFAADCLDGRAAWSTCNASRASLVSLLGAIYRRPEGHPDHLREVTRVMDVLKEQDTHTFALFPDGGVAKKQDIFGPLDEVHIYDGRSEKAVEIAIKELQVKRDSPLFMWVHLVDPHHPYDPVPEDRQFGTNDIDLYDAEILAMDRAFGMFMTAVDEHIGKENCVVAVTGDHGEAFGEHGVFFHKSGLHEEQLRVPFLIRAPSMHPQTILEPISHVDMIPTAFALAGWPLPLGDGQVLASQPASQRPVFAFHDKRGIAVRKGQFKLILSHQFGSLQVFDLDADPNERENLAPTHPDTTAELEDLILSFDVGRGGYFARLYGETAIVESARKHANSDDESTRHFAAFILRSRGLRE